MTRSKIGPPCSSSSTACAYDRRMSSALTIGVHVTASTNDNSSAITIVSANSRKNTPATPSKKVSGINTTTGVKVLPTSAGPTSLIPNVAASHRRVPGQQLGVNRFHHDDGVIDDEPHCGGDSAQRHQVETHSQLAELGSASSTRWPERRWPPQTSPCHSSKTETARRSPAPDPMMIASQTLRTPSFTNCDWS